MRIATTERRFIVSADAKLIAFLELEREVSKSVQE
jgi:hypothetical protein